jgi:hypothetical protein
MEQKPSVGRVVHYVAYGTPGGEFPSGVCRAATVTEVDPVNIPSGEVDGDTLRAELEGKYIGICVMNPTGLFFNRHIPYDESKKPGTWHWPGRDGAGCR